MSVPSDVLIQGAGVIGLSLALELSRRGARVTVVDRSFGQPMASTAAAGMLAVEDPHNPPALLPLSRLSRDLYPGFLARVEELSSIPVPFQTHVTQQTLPDGVIRTLPEASVDPRQLLPALKAAALTTGVSFAPALLPKAAALVHTTGAWTSFAQSVSPRKGQMLRVRLPANLPLREVYRSEHVYVVPRTQGPQAGTALLGATVEDAGFDTTVTPAALNHLRRLAAELVPGLAEEPNAPLLEAWAGLRPATPDGLPLLGALPPASVPSPHPDEFLATGHFRNGILLAPATAVVMADLLEGRAATVALEAFEPSRFLLAGSLSLARL